MRTHVYGEWCLMQNFNVLVRQTGTLSFTSMHMKPGSFVVIDQNHQITLIIF